MPRPKQNEIDLGAAPGVGRFIDKKLDRLGDEFVNVRDQKAELAEEMTAIETKILDRMEELNITTYRFDDQELSIKLGKRHAKVKKVKVEGKSEDEAPPED